jgi:RimK family alpha-L-glutamate ligase
MQFVILSARQGWHTDQLCRAFVSAGHQVTVLPYEGNVARLGKATGVANGSAELERTDGIVARIIPEGSLEQIIFRVDTLHRLEERGVPIMNSARTIERTVDKFYTSSLLADAGLATPETVACERAEDAFAAFRRLGDVIVKPLFGSMGLGMTRVSDEDMAFRVFRTIEVIRGVYYLQRTIDHEGCDVRAFVVGDRVIGAIERRAPGWKTNFSRGGKAKPFVLPADWAAAAITAAKAVGADYAGVDLLPAKDGTVYVIEVNGIPGWEGLQGATGIDVAGAIVQHFAVRCRNRA